MAMDIGWRYYPQRSRSAWYSLILILPMVALYEILAIVINWDSPMQLRNGADVLVRQLLDLFGLNMPYVMGILFAVGVTVTWLWQRQRLGSTRINVAYLIGMLGESFVWAVLLLLILTAADQLLIVTTSDTVLQTAFLAIGAGIYEEGVFRLVLVSGLALFFRQILDWYKQLAWGMAIALAAVLFALFHYVGISAESFTWNSFGYRSVAGMILGLLFVLRGFGITVYAHTVYDLLVLGFQTID